MRRGARSAALHAARVLAIVLAAPVLAAPAPADLELRAGARVGVVNLLDAELTHFHASRRLQESFLKTYAVEWPVQAMLMQAVNERISQLKLAPVAIAASEALRRSREDCLLNASLAKGLPKKCGAPFAQLAAAEHLDALIVFAPGLNNAAHAAGGRRADLPQYLRGWCLVTDGNSGGAPVLLNLTELLLIAPSAADARLVARQWGGDQQRSWSAFSAPADLREIPAAQLEQLRPQFGELLEQQAGTVLAHLSAR